MTTAPRTSRTLARWDHTYLWHPFTQMAEWVQEQPVIIERATGTSAVDIEGRRYLDGVSSIWVTVHGHRHPALNRALREQLGKVAHTTLLGLSNRPAIELATRAHRHRAERPDAGLLLRRRLDGGRSRLEDGRPILAAATPSPGTEADVRQSQAGLPRRYGRGDERGKYRPLPRALSSDAVSDLSSRRAVLLPVPPETHLSIMPPRLCGTDRTTSQGAAPRDCRLRHRTARAGRRRDDHRPSGLPAAHPRAVHEVRHPVDRG